jgi:hypothetical protein
MIVEPDFLDHWKTRLLVRLLGTELAPIYVIRLWAHCQSRKTDRFTDWKPTVLASVCRWETDPQTLWDAMLETYLERDGNTLVVRGWAETNAGLISAWTNGKLGGRPKKQAKPTEQKPNGNRPVNLMETVRVTDREDKIREDRDDKIEHPQTPNGGEELVILKDRIGSWFSRRASTIWSDKETKALKAVIALRTPPEDIDALETRYKSGNPYLRRDIITLLNNWNTEIDRAKQPVTQLSLTHGQPTDAIARRNSLLGDDVAEQQAEAARISRAKDEAAMRRFEATGLTPWD